VPAHRDLPRRVGEQWRVGDQLRTETSTQIEPSSSSAPVTRGSEEAAGKSTVGWFAIIPPYRMRSWMKVSRVESAT
jgi:hypothetical protein